MQKNDWFYLTVISYFLLYISWFFGIDFLLTEFAQNNVISAKRDNAVGLVVVAKCYWHDLTWGNDE